MFDNNNENEEAISSSHQRTLERIQRTILTSDAKIILNEKCRCKHSEKQIILFGFRCFFIKFVDKRKFSFTFNIL